MTSPSKLEVNPRFFLPRVVGGICRSRPGHLYEILELALVIYFAVRICRLDGYISALRLSGVMAANYWTSTQRQHWLFSRDQLAEIRKAIEESEKTLIQQYPLFDLRLLSIYINQRMSVCWRRRD